MRKMMLPIVFAGSFAALGALTTTSLAAESKAANAECAKMAARYEAEAKGKAGTQNWMGAEYWATEARSYCETNHPQEGVEAYKKAFKQLEGK